MRLDSRVVVGVLVLGVVSGCGRKPAGDYEPGGYDGLKLPYVPTAAAEGDALAADADGDGVGDDEELALGLDPDEADSDGDGFDDGVEVSANSDALDPTHYPYEGGWAIDPCRADVVASGDGVGQVASDFALLDQFGDTVRLHDFCGKEVLLVSAAMWCGPCQAEAPHVQELYERYAAQGLMVITLLGEDGGDQPPTQLDLMEWASTYGLKHPVLADPNYGTSFRYIEGYSIALPTMHLLGPGAKVIAIDTYVPEETLVANLP